MSKQISFVPTPMPLPGTNIGGGSNISRKPKTIVGPSFDKSNQNRANFNFNRNTNTNTNTEWQRSGGNSDKTSINTQRSRNNRYGNIKIDFKDKDEDRKSKVKTPVRTYGIDSRSNKPVNIKFDRNTTFYTEPGNPGEYKIINTPENVETIQRAKLAVNVVDFFPTGTSVNGIDSVAKTQFDHEFRDLLTRITTVSNASAYNKVTKQNFTLYIEKFTSLIDTWYEIDNLLAWSPDHEHQVIALTAIRNFLNTPALLEMKSDIRSFLANNWFPTEILKIIEWKNQTYRTSPLPGSSVMRLANIDMVKAINAGDVQILIDKMFKLKSDLTASQDSATQLSETTVASISGLLSGKINGDCILNINLPLSCNTSTYDEDFLEYFINSSVIYADHQIYPLNLTERTIATFKTADQVKFQYQFITFDLKVLSPNEVSQINEKTDLLVQYARLKIKLQKVSTGIMKLVEFPFLRLK